MQMDTDEIREKWITIHPLHGFSNEYFIENGLVSYLSEDRFKTNIQIDKVEAGKPNFTFDKIPIDQIAQFIRNPPKFYLNKRLGVYYKEAELLLPDHEVFEFDSLSKTIIGSDLLFLSHEEMQDYQNSLLLAGKAPLQNLGRVHFEDLVNNLSTIRLLIKQAVNGNERQTVEINLQLGDSLLYGKLDSIFGNRYLSVSNNSKLYANVLSGYVKYLMLLAQGHALEFVFISKNHKQLFVIPANEITKQEATEYLRKLLTFYKKGHLDYFDFYPQILPEMVIYGYETFSANLDQKIEDDFNNDFSDDYLEKAMEDGFLGESRFDELQQNVCYIWPPLTERLPILFNVK